MSDIIEDDVAVLEQGTAPPADEAKEHDTDVHQFVIFVVNGEVFAVDMSPVQEIIRVPEVVRVPMAPHSLEGLSNLRGKVLPIISLRRIFGFDEQDYDDSTRAIVIDQGQPLGFVVDRVVSVVAVETRLIEDVTALDGTVDTELLCGLLKNISGFDMVMVMDFGRLISREFKDISKLSKAHASKALLGQAGEDADDQAISDELQLVSFEVAGQEYAVAIEEVQEIVQVPEKVIHVPHSESHVLGVMTLRNRLLPLVSLRAMFDLPRQSADEHSRIVVISVGSVSVGVVMDTVNEVLRVPKSAVDEMPGLFARSGNLSDITQICRLNNGKRLVSIISAENMFKHTAVKDALNRVDNMDEQSLNQSADLEEEGSDDEEQVVVFKLNDEEFGVPINSVQEIVRVPEELTHVPKAPSYVEGVINLRGSVLPVIDQRLRLGMSSAERNDRQRIMVYLFDNVRMGFIVDSVTEVLKINKAAIETSPELSEEQHTLIGRVANMEKQKRMIQLIDPSRLMDRKEVAGLGALMKS
ncbi:chemotaxis protein CheW [Limnobacter sp.]|uniref:chemotaxis protein CheW n=1 Tax=Limnobacter sp. TaxID=2003368 RepID=UPI0035111C53